MTRSGTLVGLAPVGLLAIRRSRWFWLGWVLPLALVLPITVSAYDTLFPDPEAAAVTVHALGSNPTLRAICGPPFDLMTPGGFAAWRVGTFVATLVAVMAALGVIRASRAEEEDGRTELLRSAAVGRHTPLAAAVGVAVAGSTLLGGLVAAAMIASRTPVVGSVCLGAGLALTGTAFTGLGAVTAQLSGSARTARGLALAAIGMAYLVRAVADGSSEASVVRDLNWISPVAWAGLARPYADERWWVLGLPIAMSVGLVAAAFALESHRDHAAGIMPDRLGPPRAGAGLATSWALTWRLQRGTVSGWLVGLGIWGLAIGSLSGSFEQMLRDTPRLAAMFRRMGGDASVLRDAFYAAMLGLVVVVVAMAGLQLLYHLLREEDRGHTEVVVATAVSRWEFAGSHLVTALVVPTALLAVSGAGLAATEAWTSRSWAPLGTVTGAALALAPGTWLTVGMAMLLIGWAPRLAWLGWVVVGWSLFTVWVGALLDLPDWLIDATPFARLSQLPVDPMDWGAFWGTAALAAVFVALGLIGYRRRDLGSR